MSLKNKFTALSWVCDAANETSNARGIPLPPSSIRIGLSLDVVIGTSVRCLLSTRTMVPLNFSPSLPSLPKYSYHSPIEFQPQIVEEANSGLKLRVL